MLKNAKYELESELKYRVALSLQHQLLARETHALMIEHRGEVEILGD